MKKKTKKERKKEMVYIKINKQTNKYKIIEIIT